MIKTTTSSEVTWEDLAKQGDFKQAIVSYVQLYDWVTFVELQNRLKPYWEVDGDIAIEPFLNGIIWFKMSEEFAHTVNDLLNEKTLFLHPATPMSYMVDGGMPTMPIAKRKPADGQGFKEPRWLPCCLRVVPPKAASSKAKKK